MKFDHMFYDFEKVVIVQTAKCMQVFFNFLIFWFVYLRHCISGEKLLKHPI